MDTTVALPEKFFNSTSGYYLNLLTRHPGTRTKQTPHRSSRRGHGGLPRSGHKSAPRFRTCGIWSSCSPATRFGTVPLPTTTTVESTATLSPDAAGMCPKRCAHSNCCLMVAHVVGARLPRRHDVLLSVGPHGGAGHRIARVIAKSPLLTSQLTSQTLAD